MKNQEILESVNTKFGNMVAALIKPGEDILSTLTPELAHLWHMGIGIGGEGFEILECMDNSLEVNQLDIENLIEELGDSEFYMKGMPERYAPTRVRCDTVEGFDFVDGPFNMATVKAMVKGVISAGEVMDQVKKLTVYGKNDDAIHANLSEAMEQLCLRFDQLYSLTGLTREQCLEANMKKLLTGDKARYKLGKYTDQQAQDRADKGA